MSTSDVLLDNRATPCAVGIIRAAERIRDLAPGQVLDIWSRDRFAPMEIRLWAERDGHELESVDRVGVWPRRFYRLRVRAAGDAASADQAVARTTAPDTIANPSTR